jgi:ABC-type branched-subunit amino acid transport system substrate-binding protein
VALTGNLSETSFTDLIQFYSMSRQTAAVRIASPAGPEHDGILYIEAGDVIDARFGDLVGVDAVRRALRLKEGSFEVELNVRAQERTVFEPWSQLVLEELVSDDEALNAEAAGLAPSADDDRLRFAMDGDEGERYCPVCNRRYLNGINCIDDGAQLVMGNPPGRTSTPPSENISRSHPPRSVSRPDLSRGNVSRPNSRVSRPEPVRSRPPAQRPQPPPLERSVAPPPRGKTGIYIAVAVVLLAVLGAVVWRMQNKSDNGQQAAREGAQAKAQPAVPAGPRPQGVTDTEIVMGMSAPFSGQSKELGRSMKTGIDIAFAAVNDQGGINGRKIRLVALDDGYEPEQAKKTMHELIDDRKVFAFIGNVGTPTAQVTVPIALDKKMIFFGAFTGAGLLRRDPPDRYVFNYRASYAEETAATMKYLVEVRRIKPEEIAVMAQQDGYGDSGWAGVSKMLRKYDRDPDKTLRTGYKRNTTDVDDAVNLVLNSPKRIRAVVMVPSYKAAAKFIDRVKAQRPDMIFTSVSFVGSLALADELQSYNPKDPEGVIVTQVVPLPTSRSTAVLRYQDLLPKYSVGEKPDFVSLEGYITASLFLDGLRRAGPDFTTESLVDTFEAMKGIDLGLGTTLGFGPGEHQASHKVWGSILDAQGVYQPLDLE